MQTKVFITASNTYAAAYFAHVLEANGVKIMSGWHDNPEPLKRSSELSETERKKIARDSVDCIKYSDYLLIISDPDMVPGGKFVDVGVALGAGKKVLLVGRRENIKMYHPDVIAVATIAEVLRELGCEVSTDPSNAG